MGGFVGEFIRLQQSQGEPVTSYYSGWLGPDDFEGLMELLPEDRIYQNVKEEEEAAKKAKQKGYPKVKAEEEDKKKDTFEPESILIPGIVEGFSSMKLAVGKLSEEKDCNSKQNGSKRVVF